MGNLTQVRRKKCPYCETEHLVEYVANCLIAYLDGGRLNIYKCPKHNKEFRIKEL